MGKLSSADISSVIGTAVTGTKQGQNREKFRFETDKRTDRRTDRRTVQVLSCVFAAKNKSK